METQWLSSTERVMVEGAESPLQAISHGRWGVVPASEQQEILVALASLIRAWIKLTSNEMVKMKHVLMDDTSLTWIMSAGMHQMIHPFIVERGQHST